MTRSAGSLFACLLSCLGAPAPAVTPVAIAPAPPIVPAATTTTRSTWPNLYTVSGPRADLLLTRLRFDDHGASCDPSGVCTAVGYGTAEDARRRRARPEARGEALPDRATARGQSQ